VKAKSERRLRDSKRSAISDSSIAKRLECKSPPFAEDESRDRENREMLKKREKKIKVENIN
jgi:hypothetical protein